MYLRFFVTLLSISLGGISLFANPVVHVFGDSHALFCFRTIPGCDVHHLGPWTMHRVGRDGVAGLNVKNYGVKENDTAVFVFGEVDVRCHIGKIRDLQKRDEEEILSTLAYKYVATIIANRGQFKKLNCVIFAVLPPSKSHPNPDYPYYGTLKDRVSLVQKLNKKLQKLGAIFNIKVLDVYNAYATKDGSLNPAISDGHVHVRPECNGAVRIKLSQILYQIYG